MAFAGSDEIPMVSSSELCEPCMSNCKEVTAVLYCLDCDEKFCEICGNCHKKSKLSKDHRLSKVDEAPPSHVVKLIKELTTCPNHPSEEVVYICVDEDRMCCNQCANTQHRQCKRLDTIEQYMKNPTQCLKTLEIERSESVEVDMYNRDPQRMSVYRNKQKSNVNTGQRTLQETSICVTYVEKTVESNEGILAKLTSHESKLHGIITHEVGQRAFVEKNSNCVTEYLQVVHAKLESAFNSLQNQLIAQSELQTQDLLLKISNQETSAADLRDQVKKDRENMNAVKQHGQEKHVFLLCRKMSGTLKDIESKTQQLERDKTMLTIKVVERSSIDGIVKSISTALEVKQLK